jgi:hypothetical protein
VWGASRWGQRLAALVDKFRPSWRGVLDLAILEGYVPPSNNPLKGASQKDSAFIECLWKEYLLNCRYPFVSAEEHITHVSLAPNNDESSQLSTR